MTKERTVNVMTKGRTVNVMTKGSTVNAMTKGKTVNAMTKGKKTKRQIVIHKTLLRKDWTTHESHKNPGMKWGAREWKTIPAPLVAPVMLLLNDTNIIWYGNHVGHKYIVCEYK